MPKLIDLLNKNRMTLIVALPENNVELARAAVAGGADALQLHISMHGMKSFEEEEKDLQGIINNAELPVGIAVGGDKFLDEKEIAAISEAGFDFLNMGLEHLTPAILGLKKTSKMININNRFSLDEIVELSQTKFSALDAAIIPSSHRGKDLRVGDLQNYISIVLSAGIPVIVPTQCSIRPSEVVIIADTGAKGLLLTNVVTGTTAKHIEEATRRFRVAVGDLGE